MLRISSLAGVLLVATISLASAQITLTGVGKKQIGGYQGPGDIVTGASLFVSCARAYSATFAATAGPICDLVDSATGLTTYTMNILTTGKADQAGALASSACAVACKITKMYDQSGNGNHCSQAVLALMPIFTANAANSLPGITQAVATANYFDCASLTFSQPYTVIGTLKRTANFTTAGYIFGVQTVVGTWTSADLAAITTDGASNIITATATDSVFNSLVGVANGNSNASTLVVNGSATVGNVGTVGFAGASRFGRGSGTGTMDGVYMEGGIWQSAFNATQYGNMDANVRGASYGYNF